MTIQSTIDTYFNVIRERNIQGFQALIKNDENTTLILPNGKVIIGYQNIIDFHISWFEDMDWSMEYQVMNTFEVGQVGYGLLKVDYHDLNQSGESYVIHYYLNLLFEKIDGDWLLFHDQNTLIS